MPLTVKRRHKSPNWYIVGTHLGVVVDESSRTSDRRLAQLKRTKREREIEEREILGRAARTTFAEAAHTYMKSGGERRFLLPLLKHFGSKTLLKDIDQSAALGAAEAIYPNAAAATIDRQVIAPISAVVTLAASQELTAPRRFRKINQDRKRLRWLTPEEFETMIPHFGPRDLALIGFLLGSGSRPSEAFRLDRPELYLDTCEAWHDDTKTDTPRMVRYPVRAREWMLEAVPDQGPSFRTPKGKGYVVRKNTGGQIQAMFNRARDGAGLGPEVTPYILRHTWATWFYAQTKDFGALMDLGGWNKADTAMRYRKMAPQNLGARLFQHGWDFTLPKEEGPRLHVVSSA